MDIKIGAIVIGSLLWDLTEIRKKWQKELLLDKKIIVSLPIRYGRLSEVSRKGTYSMVFSNNLNKKTKGTGYIIPYKNNIKSNEAFIQQIKLLAEAEGISNSRICKSWGTVCISINPYIDKNKKEELTSLWKNIVNDTKSNLTKTQKKPEIEKFGEVDELKSIDNNWNLTINLNSLFKNELKEFDCLIATSNAIKLNSEGDNLYPTIKQIVKAIKEKDYYRYFLKNRQNNIRTFQDKNIAKILKRKYRISLKDKINNNNQKNINQTHKI